MCVTDRTERRNNPFSVPNSGSRLPGTSWVLLRAACAPLPIAHVPNTLGAVRSLRADDEARPGWPAQLPLGANPTFGIWNH